MNNVKLAYSVFVPVYNSENYLVVSVMAGKIAGHAVFYFDGDIGEFAEGLFKRNGND